MKEVTIDNVRERIARIEECAIRMPGGLRLSMNTEFELACLRQLAASHEREKVRALHASWSQETFGGVGPIGPLKHLSIEAMEAAEAPGDLSEWADLQFLMWDAQRRAGITDEQITQAMIDKLAVNKARTWPEPKDGEPRLHVKEQPAPVVRDEHLLQSLDTRINSLEIGERKGALSTQQATSLKAYRLAVQCLRSYATSDENATDNTAQQFEALATSEQPEIIGYESRVICGEPRRVPKFAGQDIEATSAGSGKP